MSIFSKVTKRTIVRSSYLAKLEAEKANMAQTHEFLKHMPQDCIADILASWDARRSQFHQDLIALVCTGFKRGGYFVEFGAADGSIFSNSWLLEKKFGWAGILSEPAKTWHKRLQRNRNCHIETDCLWSKTGEEITFSQHRHGMLSAISGYGKSDNFGSEKTEIESYLVRTISLNDMLEKYEAPKIIDFISVDTEGTELEILKNFDFSAHEICALVVEHNFKSSREELFELMSSAGYSRVLTEISGCDDWYVLPGKTPFA